jgi:hypothetical protein
VTRTSLGWLSAVCLSATVGLGLGSWLERRSVVIAPLVDAHARVGSPETGFLEQPDRFVRSGEFFDLKWTPPARCASITCNCRTADGGSF